MNERIRELAKKSGAWFVTPREDLLEDFAELIVRECVEQGKQVQSQNVSNVSKDYVDGREMGIEVFMNQIKKHFGVE